VLFIDKAKKKIASAPKLRGAAMAFYFMTDFKFFVFFCFYHLQVGLEVAVDHPKYPIPC
jgi:hypothetical protein